MELMNCRNCKKLFNYIAGEKLCPACKEKLEEKFQKVKKYIEENPRENINQVAEACDVTIKQIKYWVREERLSFNAYKRERQQAVRKSSAGKMRFLD